MPLPVPVPQSDFQAGLIEASFRGVAFAVEENGGEIGRRGQVHEYPFRDTPWAEDLGRRARRIEFSAFLLGDDVALQRDQLLNALEQKGPGLLVHPSMGSFMMQPDPLRPCRFRERWDEGRVIAFDLAFVEPGEVLYPTTSADTQAASGTAADNLDTAADGDFSARASAATTGGDSTGIPATQATGGLSTSGGRDIATLDNLNLTPKWNGGQPLLAQGQPASEDNVMGDARALSSGF